MAFSSSQYHVTIVLTMLSLQRLLFSCAVSSNVYIVYMGDTKHDDNPELVRDSHHAILAEILGRDRVKESILYSYKHGFSGFAAVLTQSQAQVIADYPGVVHVVPNRIHSLHTTRSWDFLQVNTYRPTGILSKSQSGIGTVIGVLDTGIWPESESFKDDGMEEVPSNWKGVCQEGQNFTKSNCNRKVIGARWYNKGYEAEFGKIDTTETGEFLSPRDALGHGTHTSSTAAGSLVENASFMGMARGRARGGAPSARIAIYKVCWSTGGCSSADLLAAFDDAISDGVDVLSISLGSPPPLATYVDDVVAIGSFHAVAKGISVVCSAGNSGPSTQSVINTAPWIITVAASTIDRAFPTVITLGNNQTFVGQALFTGQHAGKFYPIGFGEDFASSSSDEDSARSCDLGSLNKTLTRGKVVLCFQSRWQRSISVASRTVHGAGGVGVIFGLNPTVDVTISKDIPALQVDFAIGTYLLNYIGTSRKPMVKFSRTKTVVGRQVSPEVAYFSSRGPSSLSPSVLKPDIAAPGVNILASWSPASSQSVQLDFNIESGTSMACPHISGIVALLKSIHPTWSPAALKSALVTTASLEDEYGEKVVAEGSPHKQGDPFDYGGGHVNANKAISPGLIFDMGTSDYIRFLCSMGYNNTVTSSMTVTQTQCHKSANVLKDLNLPSFTIPELHKSLTASRTVTNVGPEISIYNVQIVAPASINVRVDPSVLWFNSTVKKLKFKVTFSSQRRVQGRFSFGNLFWQDGLHVVKVPLIVRSVIRDFYAQT